MNTITTKSGQILEFWESRAEAIHDVVNLINDMKLTAKLGGPTNEDSIWVQYKDGSHYYLGDLGEDNSFKKTNISSIIYENGSTTCVYGKVVIYNLDNVAEIYSEEVDESYKYWNVDPT